MEAKTQDVCVIDVRHICMFADFMVLATGRSHRHVYAAASGVGWQAWLFPHNGFICVQLPHEVTMLLLRAQVHEHARHILQGRSLYIEGEEGLDWISVDIGEQYPPFHHCLQLSEFERLKSLLIANVGSIVVHVFTEEARRLYNLEALWARPGKVQTAGRTLQQHMVQGF